MVIREVDMAARTKAVLGDKRLDARAGWMLDRIVASGSLVLREVGVKRDGEVAVGRFLASDKVDVAGLLQPHVERTSAAAKGRRVVAAQDTTEINFAGRDARRKGLGPAGNGEAKGFFVHPVIAIDADSEAVLGVAGAHIWTRDETPAPDHRNRRYEEKESVRWLEGAETASQRLSPGAIQVVMVADREGDIYPLFARKPADIDFVVRGSHDRTLADGGTLFAAPDAWHELGRQAVRVASRGPGDKGRTATVALKAGSVTVRRPKSSGHKQDPQTLTLGLIEAREVAVATGVTKPLLWRLVTTLPVATLSDASEAVRLYRLRWRIEEVFRTLKSDGLRLGETQVESADRLFKLAALGLVASTRIIQLVDARDGSARPATDIIDTDQIEAAARIGAALEGKTERQKNHHAKGSLAWLAWITARLGGWNCYYKPPGPKTMARGLDRLLDRIEGFTIAERGRDV